MPGDIGWRVGFVGGLAAVGLAGSRVFPQAFSLATVPSMPWVVTAGLLVGFGTRLGNGCTSGHGIFGMSNLELSSVVTTLAFMAGGISTTNLIYRVIF